MREKQCNGKCKLVKPLDDFYKLPTMKDGRSNTCKKCRTEAVKITQAALRKEREMYAI